MRDIQPLKFFGGIAMFLFIPGILIGGFVSGWYLYHSKTSPYSMLIPISGVLITLLLNPRPPPSTYGVPR